MKKNDTDNKNIVVRKSEWDENWYMLEWEEHDGREWWERTSPNSSSFRRSARISDADVEGTLEELKAIANAVKSKDRTTFRRCAVDARDLNAIYFWSPRNSTIEDENTLTYNNCEGFIKFVEEL